MLDEEGNVRYEMIDKIDDDGLLVMDETGNKVQVQKTDYDGNPIPITETKTVDLGTTTKSFKYSILSQIGLKVVQELQARCEALETKVAVLEAA